MHLQEEQHNLIPAMFAPSQWKNPHVPEYLIMLPPYPYIQRLPALKRSLFLCLFPSENYPDMHLYGQHDLIFLFFPLNTILTQRE